VGIGDSSSDIKQPGREADHLLRSSAKVKNTYICTSSPPYAFMAWRLIKHRDNFSCSSVKKLIQVSDSSDLALSYYRRQTFWVRSGSAERNRLRCFSLVAGAESAEFPLRCPLQSADPGVAPVPYMLHTGPTTPQSFPMLHNLAKLGNRL